MRAREDRLAEPAETLRITIDAPTDYPAGRTTATGTITDARVTLGRGVGRLAAHPA